jgi:hypothetical protein
MRFMGWILGLSALTILGAIRATAKPPPSVPPVAENTGPLDAVLSAGPAPSQPSSTVDLILGLPTGFRFQRPVDDDRMWHLEGFVGLELIYPIVGGGLRRRYEPLRGEHDALVVAPGFDAYLMYNVFWHSDFPFFSGGPPLAGLFTADVDFLWRHNFSECCQSQLGFKLGAGAGYGARWGVLPVAAVFSGIRW